MAKTYLRLPDPAAGKYSHRAYTQSGCTPPQPDNGGLETIKNSLKICCMRARGLLNLKNFPGRDNQPINGAKLKCVKLFATAAHTVVCYVSKSGFMTLVINKYF
jgi:hypothetical protein